MVTIAFPDHESKCRALGYLSGRFSFKSWAAGEMMVPDDALAQLTSEGIPFVVRDAPRNVGAAPVAPRDDWERTLLEAARPWGVSPPDADVSSEVFYD